MPRISEEKLEQQATELLLEHGCSPDGRTITKQYREVRSRAIPEALISLLDIDALVPIPYMGGGIVFRRSKTEADPAGDFGENVRTNIETQLEQG